MDHLNWGYIQLGLVAQVFGGLQVWWIGSVFWKRDLARPQSGGELRKALERIQNGEYAKSFILEGRTGYPSMTARRRLTEDHSIEKVGSQLRSMMPWISKNKLVDKTRN